MQKNFNDFIFKLEQKEYAEQGIAWSFVDFPDNSLVLELIEGRNGVLKGIDDECLMPNGDDVKLSNKLCRLFEAHEHFASDAKQRRSQEFAIKHYAGHVTYCTVGFVDKNRDTLMPEAEELLRSSTVPFLKVLFGDDGAQKAAELAAPG